LTATTDPVRIRELLLDNLFAVFEERDPERRLEAIARNYTEGEPAVSGIDVAVVRDGKIAVLNTLLTEQR
jgi:hypothetical protein